jgi:DNA polymerase-3 subunit delta'
MINEYPWLRDTYQPLEKNIRTHTNAHALLIQGNSGIGRLALAKFLSNIFLGFEEDQEFEIKDEIIISPIENKKSVSIDQIRSLKQSLLLTSLKGKGKVGIIYPAEAMTYPAANSLLKILEEPPKDTMIILITESIGKLPKTILSRSQIINCAHPSNEESIEWLKEKENQDWSSILSVFGNRPTLLNDIGHEYLTSQIESLSKQITGLIDGQTKPSDISDSWKTEDIELNLRVIYGWMFKYLEIRLLQGNSDDNLPEGLYRMLDQNIDHESCFKLMDDIIRLRELKYSGKGLSWNIHITKLLNPLFTDMSGLREYA